MTDMVAKSNWIFPETFYRNSYVDIIFIESVTASEFSVNKINFYKITVLIDELILFFNCSFQSETTTEIIANFTYIYMNNLVWENSKCAGAIGLL